METGGTEKLSGVHRGPAGRSYVAMILPPPLPVAAELTVAVIETEWDEVPLVPVRVIV